MKIYWSFYFLILSFSVFFVSFGKYVRFMVSILWMYVSLCWLFLCLLVLWSWRDLWVDNLTDIIIITIAVAVGCNCHKMHKCKCKYILYLENYFQLKIDCDLKYNFIIKSAIWSFCSTQFCSTSSIRLLLIFGLVSLKAIVLFILFVDFILILK